MKLPVQSVFLFGSILFLSACSGGLDDSFFQVDGTAAGAVCIEGMYVSVKSDESKDIVRRLRQYYGATESTVVNVHSSYLCVVPGQARCGCHDRRSALQNSYCCCYKLVIRWLNAAGVATAAFKVSTSGVFLNLSTR